MDFFKNLKDKVNDVLFVRDEEYDEDEEVTEQELASQPEENLYEEMTPPPYNSYSYSPAGPLNAPEYEFSKPAASAGAPEYKFTKPSAAASAPSAPEFKVQADKKSANIYNMNNIRQLNKFKLNSITLNDIYAAKDVALLMMEKDTILIVNFSPLTENQKLRAMDFLDGARCVTNAIFARLNENIIVFVPENVELRGDFQSQVDFESMR